METKEISFHFQVGIVRDRVTTDAAELNLKSLKNLAADFITGKNSFPDFDKLIFLTELRIIRVFSFQKNFQLTGLRGSPNGCFYLNMTIVQLTFCR